MLGWLYGKVPELDPARAIDEEMEARSRREFVAPSWLVAAVASAGLRDEAMRVTERAVVERDSFAVLAGTIPVWDGVRTDPRFDGIVQGVRG